MPRSVKLGWSVHGVVAPLLVSVALHGLLFLALWLWPTRTPSPPLSIQSTRIMLDTCAIEPPSPMLLPGEEMPLELRGLNVQTSLAPKILNTPPLHSRSGNTSVPPQARTGGTPIPPGSAGGSSGGSLFALPATASSVVYVLDRSVSMGESRKLDFARRELIASLQRLPSTVRFQVIDYNDYAESLLLGGQRGLLPAEPAIIDRAVSLLQGLDARGNTNHLAALRLGLDLHPDVLYFLTDAGDLRPEEVASVTLRNRGSAIHSIELTRRRAPQPDGTLARLAHDNHGTYRCVSLRE